MPRPLACPFARLLPRPLPRPLGRPGPRVAPRIVAVPFGMTRFAVPRLPLGRPLGPRGGVQPRKAIGAVCWKIASDWKL